MQRRPSTDQMRLWFSADTRTGLGVVCGPISGGLECLEFDDRAVYDQFKDAAQQTGLGDFVKQIEQGYCEDTPGGGVHWLYRCEVVAGNTKLARRPKTSGEKQSQGDRVKALIETRGQGGFVVVAPSGGLVHPSGQRYRLRSGAFESIVTIQPHERTALFTLAQSFDEIPRRDAQRPTTPSVPGGRPGDDYNERTTWAQVIEPHGWTPVHTRGVTTCWRRPGKTLGISATTNHADSDLLYVFSTSTPFESDRSYDKFSAFAILNHGGKFAAAASALAAKGYGKAATEPAVARTNVVPFRPASSTNPDRAPAHPDVETLLGQCDLATIPAPSSAANMANLEERLRRLRTALEGADALRIRVVRNVLVDMCQSAALPSPAALIDSALAPVTKTATIQHARDVELFADDDPWPNSVDGAVVLDDLGEAIRQHVVLPPGADIAVPLWCVHSHLMDCWDVSPFLLISSPVWRCGKSTLADFVAGFSRRALTSSNASDAALFRCIEKYSLTLVLDEADSWITMREELRGILNSGHKRSGAIVLRADGDTHEPRPFSTWAAKVVALIGRPPATIGDRSIVIQMRRKTKDEQVQRIRTKQLRALCEPLRRQCSRWADDHREALSTSEPLLPEVLSDRAQDNWESLIAIADELGGVWPEAARDAAKLLSTDAAQEESTGIDLLMDVKSTFDEVSPPDGWLSTKTILDALCDLEDRPWATWERQKKAMTPQALASQLKPFGPRPHNQRVGGSVRKGYYKADFLESWGRYASGDPNLSDQAATPLQVNKDGGKSENPVRYTLCDVADAHTAVSPINTGENATCSGVAARDRDRAVKPIVEATPHDGLLAAVAATDRPGTPSIRADEELL